MKLFLLFLLVFLSVESFSATCTPITRTNAGANSVLTSSKYNTDLNTAYTAINAADGGCIADGSVELGALNTTDFYTLFNGVKQGCEVTRSNSNTLSVGRCLLTVNGGLVNTAAATTQTWGCSGCSSELASTNYYLYAATTSASSTLNLLILTGAPNANGLDGSGNKVLAKFHNNSSSDILEAVQNWTEWGFPKIDNSGGSAAWVESCLITNGGTAAIDAGSGLCGNWLTSVNRSGAGVIDVVFKNEFFALEAECVCTVAQSGSFLCSISSPTATGLTVVTTTSSTGATSDKSVILTCVGKRY